MNYKHTQKQYIHSIGFTLVEVLIAMAIASIGFLGVASMVNRTNTGSIGGYHLSMINNVATYKMDSLSLKAFNRTRYIKEYYTDESDPLKKDFSLLANDTSHPYWDDANTFPPYYFKWTIKEDCPISKAFTITLTVEGPPTRSGHPIQTVKMQRVMVEYGK